MNQEDSEHNEVDGMKKGVDSGDASFKTEGGGRSTDFLFVDLQ